MPQNYYCRIDPNHTSLSKCSVVCVPYTSENTGKLGTDAVSCTFEQESDCGMSDDSGEGWIRARDLMSDHTTATDQGKVRFERNTEIKYLICCTDVR